MRKRHMSAGISACRRNSGQVMLLTVVLMSATLLVATAVAGFLARNQFRQVVDAKSSAKAIYAADTGLGLGYYLLAGDADMPEECSRDFLLPNNPYVFCSFGDGVQVEVTCANSLREIITCDNENAGSVRSIRSVGRAGEVVRILLFRIE